MGYTLKPGEITRLDPKSFDDMDYSISDALRAMEEEMHRRAMRERERAMYMGVDVARGMDYTVMYNPLTGQYVKYPRYKEMAVHTTSSTGTDIRNMKEELAEKAKEEAKAKEKNEKLQSIISYYYTRR